MSPVAPYLMHIKKILAGCLSLALFTPQALLAAETLVDRTNGYILLQVQELLPLLEPEVFNI